MTNTLQVRWDASAWRGAKVESALATAVKKAGGDATRAMKAESTRKVRSRKRQKAGKVNRALPLTFPKGKEISRLAWRMGVEGAMVPVSAYPSRQTRKGVSVEINKGKRVLIKGAFFAKMASGHMGVFRREGAAPRIMTKGAFKGQRRQPITEAFTTRVSDVFKDGDFIPDVQRKAKERFASAFARLMPMELEKARGKGRL